MGTVTLDQALRHTAMTKWQGKRCYATNMSQAGIAILGVLSVNRLSANAGVGDVLPEHIHAVTAEWYKLGVAPATINKRLNCLSAMGVSVDGCRVKEPKQLKWWLSPEAERRVVTFLEQRASKGDEDSQTTADFIWWTTRTGLRVEETLRLTSRDFTGSKDSGYSVTVPGSKTASAQATLPLSAEVGYLVENLLENFEHPHAAFPISYEKLHAIWEECREHLGVSYVPTATLKSLRRSAARYLHIQKGMPLDMLRQYLRHEDINTTMGYLRLTGGYGEEEMRRWL